MPVSNHRYPDSNFILRLVLRRRPKIVDFLLAAGLAALSIFLSTLFYERHWGPLFTPPFAAAVLVATFCDLGPGLVAAIGGALGLDYFSLGQVLRDTSSFLRLLICVGIVVIVSSIVSQLRVGYLRAEQLKLEAEGAKREADLQSEAKDHIISIVSHDLRNPLASVQMYAALLVEGIGGRSGRLNPIDGLAGILRSVDRMKRITDDLLDAARIERGQFTIEKTRVDLGALVNEAVDGFRALAGERKILLKTEVPSPPRIVTVDQGRMIQALGNLIHNAIKFSPIGGMVRVSAKSGGRKAVICVADQGPGIPLEDVPHIFERHWTKGSPKLQGTGLGLFIAKGIAKSHGGDVAVAGGSAGGATLCLLVPLETPDVLTEDSTIRATQGYSRAGIA